MSLANSISLLSPGTSGDADIVRQAYDALPPVAVDNATPTVQGGNPYSGVWYFYEPGPYFIYLGDTVGVVTNLTTIGQTSPDASFGLSTVYPGDAVNALRDELARAGFAVDVSDSALRNWAALWEDVPFQELAPFVSLRALVHRATGYGFFYAASDAAALQSISANSGHWYVQGQEVPRVFGQQPYTTTTTPPPKASTPPGGQTNPNGGTDNTTPATPPGDGELAPTSGVWIRVDGGWIVARTSRTGIPLYRADITYSGLKRIGEIPDAGVYQAAKDAVDGSLIAAPAAQSYLGNGPTDASVWEEQEISTPKGDIVRWLRHRATHRGFVFSTNASYASLREWLDASGLEYPAGISIKFDDAGTPIITGDAASGLGGALLLGLAAGVGYVLYRKFAGGAG